MQQLLKIPFVRNRLFARALEQFRQEQEKQGVLIRSDDIPERLCALRTVLIDSNLIMQGKDIVRLAAAPVEICDRRQLKHQKGWMLLMAGVSLACAGYEPLETFARDMNFTRERMAGQFPLVETFPYDNARGIETTLHRDAGGLRAYTKGGVQAVLAHCDYLANGKERPIEPEDREKALGAAMELEGMGLHTLSFATKLVSDDAVAYEEGMTYLGTLGMGDLPHPDCPGAMDALRAAGLRPVLVCGGEITGGAVRASGVLRDSAGMMEAEEMDCMADEALHEAVEHADAYLHMDWRRKTRLAKALRADGATAVLTSAPETGGIILAFSGGGAPDVLLEGGGVQALMKFLEDCRTLVEAYRPE